MLEKIFDKILNEKEIENEKVEEKEIKGKEVKGQKKGEGFNLKELGILVLIFILALLPRLFFLFSNDPQNAGPDWYGDVYHHWQIAYLSKEIGFKKGFLKLWDLKGMEYFWGLAHPLVLIILFTIFNSVNILIPRLLSIFCGSLVTVLIYLLIKRFFSQKSALICALWAIFLPVFLFSNTLGMQEELGLVFLLAGLFFWPRKPILTGIFLFFASMTRAEYWLFSLALVVAALFDRQKETGKKATLLTVYFLLIFLYTKYLAVYTGNYIFPIYWNFLASVVGRWFTNINEPLEPSQVIGQLFGRGLFILGGAGTILTFLKRKKGYLFFLLGFFNITFIGFMFGFGAYIHGFFERFYVDRLLAFPYLFLGILTIIFFLEFLPNYFGKLKILLLPFSYLVSFVLILVSQVFWQPIFYYWRIAQKPYSNELKRAELIKRHFKAGKILFPAGRPVLTYTLVKNYKISGKNLISDMYDPFFYKNKESEEELEKKMFSWLKKEEITLIVDTGKTEYQVLYRKYPERFRLLENKEGISLYEFF